MVLVNHGIPAQVTALRLSTWEKCNYSMPGTGDIKRLQNSGWSSWGKDTKRPGRLKVAFVDCQGIDPWLCYMVWDSKGEDP